MRQGREMMIPDMQRVRYCTAASGVSRSNGRRPGKARVGLLGTGASPAVRPVLFSKKLKLGMPLTESHAKKQQQRNHIVQH